MKFGAGTLTENELIIKKIPPPVGPQKPWLSITSRMPEPVSVTRI
jgi:hypothetical protein